MTLHTTIHPAAANQPATYWHDGAAVAVPALSTMARVIGDMGDLADEVRAMRDSEVGFIARIDAVAARARGVGL